MRHLLTLLSLLFVGSVWADDFNFNSPRAKAAMEKYQYDKEDLLRDLEAALEHERTKGSLEEAIKIRDAIANLKQQPDAPVANAQIPADAVEWNGHYYKGFKQPMTWHAAKDFCNSIGGHLLRIQDARENSFAQKLAIETKTGGWIDGSDEVTNGEWVFSNSEPMKYFNWDSAVGEPSNSNYRMHGNTGIEHHISLALSGLWHDKTCGIPMTFICEWEGDDDVITGSKSIPADAVEWNGHHYWVSNEGTTWHEAKAKCEKMGGHLARITNQAEHNFIDRTLDQQIKTPIKQQKQSERDHWMDGERGADGVWRFSNGTKITYFNWHNDPAVPFPNTNDRWLFLGWPEANHGWANFPSGVRMGFICEWDGSAPETPTKPERTKPKPEEPIKKLSPQHAKRILDDANLWEGKPGVWFLKRANNFSGRTYERLSQSNRIRSALASVNGRLPTPDEINNPPSRR